MRPNSLGKVHAVIKSIFLIAAMVFVFMAAFTDKASAQFLLDQALSSSVGGGNELGGVAHSPADADTILQNIKQQGYSNIAVSPTNPQQYTATNPIGMSVLLTIEPITGKILSVTPQ